MAWTEPHNTVPANQQKGAYSNQSQDRGKKKEGMQLSLFVAVQVHAFGGRGSKVALKGECIWLAIIVKYQ